MTKKIFEKFIYKLRTSLVMKEIPADSVLCDFGCRKDVGFLKEISKKIKYGYGFDIDILPYKDFKIETGFADLDNGKVGLNDSVGGYSNCNSRVGTPKQSRKFNKRIFSHTKTGR